MHFESPSGLHIFLLLVQCGIVRHLKLKKESERRIRKFKLQFLNCWMNNWQKNRPQNVDLKNAHKNVLWNWYTRLLSTWQIALAFWGPEFEKPIYHIMKKGNILHTKVLGIKRCFFLFLWAVNEASFYLSFLGSLNLFITLLAFLASLDLFSFLSMLSQDIPFSFLSFLGSWNLFITLKVSYLAPCILLSLYLSLSP